MGELFRVRVASSSMAHSYLSPQDSRPLSHPAIDRALQLGGPGGPPHVKLVVEWDLITKERLFGSIQEEVVQDTESVRLQQQAHQQQHSCTLDECFQLYTKEEQLAPDDAWRCPHCQVLQQGVVKLSLWTLPDILIIHLKRFHQAGERRAKLSTMVWFPLCGLNMAPHVAKRSQGGKQAHGQWASWKQLPYFPESSHLDFLYDLYAVCNHHGSMQGGHYTAYCRNSLDGHWYSYDDSAVELVLEDEVCTRGAYILFYQRRNVIPSWSASSSMRGSTSSSMSDHWLTRLSRSSKRESLVSWSSMACPSLLKAPDSPVFSDAAAGQEKGGFESRPLVRGIQGLSVSMKASPTKPRLGASKPAHLRWSFAGRDKPQAAMSGELVEYLESGRRPRYTNESIVPLMTDATGSESPPALEKPPLNLTGSGTGRDHGAGGASGNSQDAIESAVENHNKVPPATERAGTVKRGSKPKEATGLQRTPKKLELPSNTGVLQRVKDSKSNGSKVSSNGAAHAGTCLSHSSLKDRGVPVRDGDHSQRIPAKAGEHGRDRKPEAQRQQGGKSTIFRAGFLKKEPKRSSESQPAMGSSQMLHSNGALSGISEGRANGTLGWRDKEILANGRISWYEIGIKRSQSSTSIHSKAAWALRRSASLHQHSHSTPVETTACGTLQSIKYHMASLSRKKPVPESSF